MTLTGFDNRQKTPREWQAYIEGLQYDYDQAIAAFKALRLQGSSTDKELKAAFSRIDILSEFIMRAKWELE